MHVALPLYVFARTGSASATALTFTAEMVAGAALGVVGGICADRFDRQHVLMISFLARTVLLLSAWAAEPIATTIVLGVAARALGQLDNPSFDALMPSQAQGDLQQVLAVRRFIQSVSIVVGPAVGAYAVWAIGEKPTIAVSATPFVAAAALHLGLLGLDHEAPARRAANSDAGLRPLLGGMATIARTPFVRRLSLYWALEMATVAMCLAAAVPWFKDTLRADDYWYGISVSAYGIGAALGMLLAGGHRFRTSLPRLLVALAPVYAAACALGVLAEVPWLLGAGWLAWGMSLGPEMVTAEPAFVEAIPSAGRGRAYAGVGVGNTIGMAVGYALAAALLDQLSPRATTLITAAMVLAIGAMWLGPALAPQAVSSATNSANTSA